jgi:hypothetical protein
MQQSGRTIRYVTELFIIGWSRGFPKKHTYLCMSMIHTCDHSRYKEKYLKNKNQCLVKLFTQSFWLLDHLVSSASWPRVYFFAFYETCDIDLKCELIGAVLYHIEY